MEEKRTILFTLRGMLPNNGLIKLKRKITPTAMASIMQAWGLQEWREESRVISCNNEKTKASNEYHREYGKQRYIKKQLGEV